MFVEKEEETDEACVYAFGVSEAPVGRVRVVKASGDVEIAEVPENTEGPDPRFLLAHLVPRFHEYQARQTYPDRDRWEV